MSSPLSSFEPKELIRLCESGRLYEVEAWLAAGRSLIVPKEVRKTPLRVAISTGFHSLRGASRSTRGARRAMRPALASPALSATRRIHHDGRPVGCRGSIRQDGPHG